MTAGGAAQVEGTVTADGDLLVPADAVRALGLEPGQRVPVTVGAPRRFRNMRGVLAGRLPEVSAEQIAEARREAWGSPGDPPSVPA